MLDFIGKHFTAIRVVFLIIFIGFIVVEVCIYLGDGKNNDKDACIKLESALSNLESLDKMYVISNVMQAPDGDVCYIEVCDGDTSYTEYPVDEDGNYGTIPFQSSKEGTEYVLTDWLTQENKGYTLLSDDTWVSFPKEYSKLLKSRETLYFNLILKEISELKFKETVTVDIGSGDEAVDFYTAKLSSSTVRKILGMNSEQLYKIIKEESSDENIKKLCNYYLEDTDFTMTFSDAKLTVGVVNGTLRYTQLEAGGLGYKLFWTKSVLLGDTQKRQEPDFSKVSTYESTLKSLADFVSKYDSYEEALLVLEEESTN